MFTNRRPYYGLKMSTTDFFREPVRYLKESNTQESMMEKPYYQGEYHKMHLSLPDFKFKPRERTGPFGPIVDEAPIGGFAKISFGEAKCNWDIARADNCISGSVIVTMSASYYWGENFSFAAGIASDSIGVSLTQLAGADAGAWDTQDYRITFPENANGSVTICGSASTHTLISQTFETAVAGMPVSIELIGGALRPVERFHGKSPALLKSTYGEKGASCGCITLSSNCTPPCECRLIGCTTIQMEVNETQELTVIEPVDGCTYKWSLESGSGILSPQTGTVVEYTAPSSNAGCSNNPTITLSVGDSVCDTLRISVNQDTGGENAYLVNNACVVSCHKNSGGTGLCGLINCTGNPEKYCAGCTLERYGCDDALKSNDLIYANNNILDGETCSLLMSSHCSDSSTEDLRTEAQTGAGCCPAGLL